MTLAWEARGDGRPIFFVHGVATDRRVMIESFERVFVDRPGWRRVYVDLPGHGESKAAPADISADAFLGALAELARAEAGPHPALVGYSYGGYLAMGLASLLGDASGLFLTCPVVEPDFAMRSVAHRRVAVSEAELPFSADVRERQAFLEISVVQTRPVLEEFQRVVHPANIGVDPAARDGIRNRYQLTAVPVTHLRAFGGPISIVCGRDDHWVGYEDAVRLLRALSRAELHVLPNCGHLLPLERPDALAALFGSWLTQLA